MKKLFGTDGIRGIANKEPITPETVLKLGKVVASMFVAKKTKVKALIGKDTRMSGNMIESALIAGLTSMGVDAFYLGVIPTPAVAYLTKFTKADFGVVISASHNPFYDNGIKFFSKDGLKLPDEIEMNIEAKLLNGNILNGAADDKLGRIYTLDEFKNKYEGFLLKTFKGNLKGFKIVLDCANGATYKIAPEIYKKLGAKVIVINDRPNGTNINKDCGSLHTNAVSKAVIKNQADIGFSFDGDGDRVMVCDNKGNIVDGDYIMAICSRYLKSSKKLKNNLVVATVMSNIGLEISLKDAGINLFRAPVGDKFVFENMVKYGGVIGGEQSGHIIFLDKLCTGDGILTSLQVLKVIKETGESLSVLSECMKKYPQILVNVELKEKKDLNSIPSIRDAIKNVEDQLKDKGRVLVRYSGTQPLVRVMLEGEDQKQIKDFANSICDTIRRELV